MGKVDENQEILTGQQDAAMPKDNQTFDLDEQREAKEKKVDLNLTTLMKELEKDYTDFEVPKEITNVSKFRHLYFNFRILLTKKCE